MRTKLFITMLLCLFAFAAQAQNIKGYYTCGSIVNRNLQTDPDRTQTRTDFGVPGGNGLTIYITAPEGKCTFTFDKGNSNSRVTSVGDRNISVYLPEPQYPGSEYCIITVECNGEFMEIQPYILDHNYH